MRKFKFMSKAVVGMMAVAMTMGSLSGVAFSQPTAVYAAATAITLMNGETPVEGDLTIKQGESLTLTASTDDTAETVTCAITAGEGNAAPEGLTVTAATTADSQDVVITVGEAVPVGAYKLTITAATTTTVTKEVTINVTEKAPVTDPGEDGDYSIDAWIDAVPMTLTVKTNDPYFTVDVLKTASETEKPSKSYTYANTNKQHGVIIDLGFLKVKKGNILNIYGSSVTDKSKGMIVTIEGQPAKEKITVDVNKASLAEAIGKSETDAEKYEYSTSFGSDWYDLDNLDFEAAKVAGTTIVLRLKAEDVSKTETTAAKSTPAGPEIKVKIPAAPKAPKITVDYVKGTVKVTDKMQIALLPKNGPVDEATGWKTAKKGMTREEIVKELLGDETSTAEFKMVVRTAAAGKKSASVPVIVPIKEKPVLGYVDDTKKDSVTVTVGSTTATLKAVRDKDGGLTFTPAGGTFLYEDGGKWKTVTTKLIKSFGSDKVKVRLAGVKFDKNTPNSGSFASTELELEVPKPAETTTPPTTAKADAPTAGTNAGEVKVGEEVVLTISRDTTTNTTIKFETVTGKEDVVATLEYRVGSSGDFAPITATLVEQVTTELTIEVRVKATTDKAASDVLPVTVSAVEVTTPGA